MDFGPDAYLSLFTRLAAAFALGGLVGFEREWSRRPAGLRTHILVAVASALFTIMSVAMARSGEDMSRIAAGVVSGIGFIGAGTIMRYGNAVRGLTTAATLWMVAAIGMACGFAWYWAAAVTTIFALSVLIAVDWVETKMHNNRNTVKFVIFVAPDSYVVHKVVEIIDQHEVAILDLAFEDADQSEATQVLNVKVRLKPASNLLKILCEQFEEIEEVVGCSIV